MQRQPLPLRLDTKRPGEALYELAQIQRFPFEAHATGLKLAEIEHVVDQAQQELCPGAGLA